MWFRATLNFWNVWSSWSSLEMSHKRIYKIVITYHWVLRVKFGVIFDVRGIPDIFFDCLGLDWNTRVKLSYKLRTKMTTQYITWVFFPPKIIYPKHEKKNIRWRYGRYKTDWAYTQFKRQQSVRYETQLNAVSLQKRAVFHATSDEKMTKEEFRKTCVKWILQFYIVVPSSN